MSRVSESAIIFATIFTVLGIILFFNKSTYPSESFNLLNEGFQEKISYSSYPTNENLDNYTGLIFGSNSKLDCKRVDGYDGVFCTPKTALSTKIDPFGGTTSNMTCEGSGLSKGNGNVCLSAEQPRLLTTRGGNAISS